MSHKLLVRAGMVRQVGAGMWTWLPLGWRVKKRVQEIIREEMDRIGGQEMLMPVLHPAEIWKRSGRYDIDVVFKLKDRSGRDLVLAITHEEIVALHASRRSAATATCRRSGTTSRSRSAMSRARRAASCARASSR